MDLMNCVCTFHKFYKKHLKGLTQVDWPVDLTYTFLWFKSIVKSGNFYVQFLQKPSFRYLITSKQEYNIWKWSKKLNLLFSKTTQGNSVKFFTAVLPNQDLLILI